MRVTGREDRGASFLRGGEGESNDEVSRRNFLGKGPQRIFVYFLGIKFENCKTKSKSSEN